MEGRSQADTEWSWLLWSNISFGYQSLVSILRNWKNFSLFLEDIFYIPLRRWQGEVIMTQHPEVRKNQRLRNNHGCHYSMSQYWALLSFALARKLTLHGREKSKILDRTTSLQRNWSSGKSDPSGYEPDGTKSCLSREPSPGEATLVVQWMDFTHKFWVLLEKWLTFWRLRRTNSAGNSGRSLCQHN